jgi:hypothetical protein
MSKVRKYGEALEYAKKIIEAYEGEIREAGYADKGFCQGKIFKDAIKDIDQLQKEEAVPSTIWEEELERAAAGDAQFSLVGMYKGKQILIANAAPETTKELMEIMTDIAAGQKATARLNRLYIVQYMEQRASELEGRTLECQASGDHIEACAWRDQAALLRDIISKIEIPE